MQWNNRKFDRLWLCCFHWICVYTVAFDMQCLLVCRRAAQLTTTRCASFHTRRPHLGGAESGDSTKRKRQDNVDDKFALVYKVPEGNFLQIANGLFCGAAYAGSIALSANIYQLFSASDARAAEAAILEATGGEAAVIGGLAVVVSLSVLLAKIVRMIPLRIYKHETSYMAIFQSAIPSRNCQFAFNKGDVHETIPYKWLPQIILRRRHVANLYRLEDIAIFLHHRSFKKPIHLIEMLSNADKFIRRTKMF